MQIYEYNDDTRNLVGKFRLMFVLISHNHASIF